MMNRRAFSLLELLVVVAVSGIIATAIATFTRSSLMTTDAVQDRHAASHTCRAALARIAREVALAKTISAAEKHRLAFTSTDVTGDGTDDDIAYEWDSGTNELTRTVNGEAELFAENVADFRFGYQYETEDQVAIAAPGDTVAMTLGQFAGIDPATSSLYDSDDLQDDQRDVRRSDQIRQTFTNQVETPAATSATVTVRTKFLPPATDMLVYLADESETVATGRIDRHALALEFQDIVVPLTWQNPDKHMEVDKRYYLYLLSATWEYYSGTVRIQKILSGPSLPNGLELKHGWTDYGPWASIYFAVRGDLPVTTPRRTITPASILKIVRATITVAEDDQEITQARSWKVVNQ